MKLGKPIGLAAAGGYLYFSEVGTKIDIKDLYRPTYPYSYSHSLTLTLTPTLRLIFTLTLTLTQTHTYIHTHISQSNHHVIRKYDSTTGQVTRVAGVAPNIVDLSPMRTLCMFAWRSFQTVVCGGDSDTPFWPMGCGWLCAFSLSLVSDILSCKCTYSQIVSTGTQAARDLKLPT